MKRVTQMTRDGRRKTVSALVVVGNKKGAVGMKVMAQRNSKPQAE